MENFTPVSATLGGILIGLAASLLLLFNGKIAGISGILAGLLSPQRGDAAWRASFLAGLLVGGVLLLILNPAAFGATPLQNVPLLVIAGLLVGYGTSLGRGCTSGHGVCGISRLSWRSIAATGTFMVMGMVTVYIMKHVI